MTSSALFHRLRAHRVGRYGVAVVATVLATALKLSFPTVIGHGEPVAIYLGVVMLAAWFGGFGPGLLATLLFTLAGIYWFAAPYEAFDVETPHDMVRLSLAMVEGATIALLAGALHRARAAAGTRAEQLAKTNDELRREAEARARAEASLARATEQLLHSQKMQAIGAVAGGVAHDFNNFLTVILNYSSLLLARLEPNSANHEMASELKDAAERAAALTRGLLAFARKTKIEPQVLDLNESVRGLERMLSASLGATVSLATALDSRPALVLADPTQIEQLLTNLTLNARDAMPDGGTVTITTSHVSLESGEAQARGLSGGAHVELTVRDTGCGIPPDGIARIFEPFFTTKEIGKGTGLGLAIVHGVVARAGGSVWVESVVGQGTEFKVLFPESSTPLPLREPPPPPAAIANTSAHDERGGDVDHMIEPPRAKRVAE